MADTLLLAGVDEAGLGPILGPLTLGFSVFRAPDGVRDLWKALGGIVSDAPHQDASAFVVADSKLVFKRTPRCAKRLEATALGFLALLDPARDPRLRVGQLLWERPGELAVEARELARHPWYRDLATLLPRHWDAGQLELRVESLHRALRKARVELVDAGARAVPEGELNRSFDETDNKSRTHWNCSQPIYRRIWELPGNEPIELVIDRHGGRMHYGAQLARAFPDARVELVDEAPECSRYHVAARDGSRVMRVTFAEQAERLSFAVALASCLAKFARETAMDALNAWFCARQQGLAPTAGYTTDGRRWLADAERTIAEERLDLDRLVRRR